MGYEPVHEENGRYIVEDSTNGGYVDRMTHHFQQKWKTVWDKDLNMLEIHLNHLNLTDTLMNKDKEDYDYHRAVRTRGRHLKLIKDFLGIAYKKPEEKTEEPIILLQRGAFSRLDPLKGRRAIVHDKTLDIGGSRYKKTDIHWTLQTPEKVALAKEYNEKLQEFLKYQKETMETIFGDEK
jgi:hypothetical protein